MQLAQTIGISLLGLSLLVKWSVLRCIHIGVPYLLL